MKKVLVLFVFLLSQTIVFGQVKFLNRFEVRQESYDPIFEIMRTELGLVSFRTLQPKSLSGDRVFQYYISDENLQSPGLVELPIRSNYDMIGYDTEGDRLYVLLARGQTANAPKYILEVNLRENKGLEFQAENLLDLNLVEFLVQNKKAVFMGTADARPVLQIFDLEDKSIHTVQGVYGNNTQVLQVMKVPDLETLEVVVSRKGQFRNRETLILTYDMFGNLVREVKVDQFGSTDQEILDGLLLADKNYQQVMIGSFGQNARGAHQGMYIMEINEFGEYKFKLYTLEDFPNFYNYLKENQKEKKDKQVEKELEQNKIPTIRNTYAIRDVRETEDAFYVYFDQLNVTISRGGGRPTGYSPFNTYRYDRLSRMGYAPYYMDPLITSNVMQNQLYNFTEYKYVSAHFAKIAKQGQVIWDNSATYQDFTTGYPEPFGEIAILGEDLYHAYLEDDQIIASFFRNGEKVFERLSFGLELENENERIRYSDLETLRLVHWYDNYFLISGRQSIRFLNSENKEEVKDVFFMNKIVLDGDLYQPEEKVD
ncbi:hypothetical protein DFQ04_2711 [Algoriphagus boseongensis]|uniref:Uncharacterized protein n=1 Tax=Algoriphagus boseongensis TaxID=1442587 RepID=A0A4R6T7E4_9BACT|nr:transcriptional regulator [Algoriphagus boseongensis]TDQ16590.1 hypothetical protein DFQ04_2711 [Algoriphagus boseongensis]